MSHVIPRHFTSAKSVYSTLKKTRKSNTAKSATKRKSKNAAKKVKRNPEVKLENENIPPAVPLETEAMEETQEMSCDQFSDATTSDGEESAFEDSVKLEEDKSLEEPLNVIDYKILDSLDYYFVDDSTVVVFVPFSKCFYLKGRCKLAVLSGAAEVLGHVAENSDESYNIYSPRGYSLLCVRAVQKPGLSTKESIIRMREMGLNLDEKQLKTKLKNNTVLKLQVLQDLMVDYLNRLLEINVIRREQCVPLGWEGNKQNRFKQLCEALDCSIILRGAVFSARFYQQPDHWAQYLEKLSTRVRTAETDKMKLLICGGKGVGKSTFLRYTVNRLLGCTPSVLVLDFDPGQPEFFPAGCVSAVLVTKPLLGPGFTHLDRPILQSYFIGSTDVTACPRRYVESCMQLINFCHGQPSLAKIPTVINTMGFTTGVGFDVTLDLIRLVEPSHVLQITSRSVRRNFPALLTHEYVQRHRRGWMTEAEPVSSPFEFETVRSASEESERSTEEWGFQASTLHQLGLMSYFSRLSNSPSWTLCDAVPVKLSWNRLNICISHQFVPPSLALASLNSSLVALCVLNGESAKSVRRYEASGYPTILEKLPSVPCLGYGIVRCVDLDRRCVYLITPEPLENMAQVNCLVTGAIQIPSAMLLDVPSSITSRKDEDIQQEVQVPYAVQGPSASEPSCRPFRKYNPVFTIRAGS